MKPKCRFCKICNGYGCIDQMPGMGGPFQNKNFILNYKGWEKIRNEQSEKDFIPNVKIRLAPMTGGVENVGYFDERTFYRDLIKLACDSNALLSIGDGCPDSKLDWGIEAVKKQNKKTAVFIKPYPQEKIWERFEKAFDIAESFGIDIDSYNIATMRKKVHLEKKSAFQLLEIKKFLSSKGFPFIIKGIFTQEDLDLVREVKPDVAYISNHGGRVETREGSSAQFLFDNHKSIKSSCNEIWVDGGIRNRQQMKTAAFYGASEVLLGRPFASALCKGEILRF